MFTYLRDHALRNVWCTPDQDKQVIFKPARISRGAGIKNDIKIEWELYKLPTPNERYNVYQIGQIHPVIIGLIEQVYRWHPTNIHPTTVVLPNSPNPEYYSSDNIWIPFDVICNEMNQVADFYIDNGTQLPRFTTYAMVTDDKNLIIAVKDQPGIVPNLYLKNFYMRLYSNAFFGSTRSDDYAHEIYVKGKVINNTSDILDINAEITTKALERGAVFIYINGIFSDSVNVLNTFVGDVVEFYHDSTVKSVIEIPLATAKTFDSIKDSKRKFLLTYPESDVNDLIDYQDDVDYYLIAKPDPLAFPNKFKGCYYHKNKADALRMVTHKDYSMCVPYVLSYVEDHAFFNNNSDNVIVRMYIRESGYDRPLINENNRIKELYKLTDQQVTDAMVGIDATLVNWRADTLENSAYTEIMRSKSINVTKQLVQDAYGYNAISKLIADSPLPVQVTGLTRHVTLPEGLRVNSTIFEYDINGKLLERHWHINDPDYFPLNPATEMVEGIMGLSHSDIDMVFGESTSLLDSTLTYRMYKTRIIAGQVQWNDWVDVTGTNDYIVTAGVLIWTVDSNVWYTCLKPDGKFICYDFVQSQNDHLINHTVASEETHDSITFSKAMDIPPANIDLWLNGNYLIEGLDYFINWPDIVVCNKEFLIDGQDQNFTIRCIGYCNSDMELEVPDEFGFVINGVLSRNTAYDIRDDKVVLISIEGAIRSREDLIFTEELPTIKVPDVRNGAPYVIKDGFIPMRDATVDDVNTLRPLSLAIDKAVSDYLTLKIGAEPPTYPNLISHHYNLFSPFCSKIMYDLKNGTLVLPGITGFYSEMDMTNWLSDYEYLLPFDPCTNNIDSNYVRIHPHPLYTTIELDFYQYAFMERVISFYLFNKVDLTRFVTMVLSP